MGSLGRPLTFAQALTPRCLLADVSTSIGNVRMHTWQERSSIGCAPRRIAICKQVYCMQYMCYKKPVTFLNTARHTWVTYLTYRPSIHSGTLSRSCNCPCTGLVLVAPACSPPGSALTPPSTKVPNRWARATALTKRLQQSFHPLHPLSDPLPGCPSNDWRLL